MINRNLKELLKLIYKIIKHRILITFYYESESGKKEWRTIEPYILALTHDRKLKVVGLPTEELLKKNINDRKLGHYHLTKIDMAKFKPLSKTYDQPHVPRHKIDDTPTIKVIYRFIYEDENTEEVVSELIKLEEL